MRLHSFERIKEILTPYVLIAFLASCAEEELFSSDIEELSVDLGLSVIWSIHNVGANSPEEYGGYYAWGELEEKMIYSWFDYKYYLLDLPSSISGTEFDAAYAKWGDGWRLPTLSEVKELLDKCSWLASTSEGINGIYITGPNGNSIFLPATGFYNGEGINFQGTFGTYWIGEQDKQDKLKAYFLSFDDNRGWGGWSNGYRFTGRPIRPVRDKQ